MEFGSTSLEAVMRGTQFGLPSNVKPSEYPGSGERHQPKCPDQYTVGETIRGFAELSIMLAAIVLPILYPHPLALPLMAMGALIVIGLAVWDDHARR